MAREFNEYEREVYGLDEVIVEEKPAIEEVIKEEIVVEEKPIVVEEVEKPLVVETIDPPYKSKKFIAVEDEKELYNTLNKKYQYDSMNAEQKAMAFIAKQNPELDDKDLAFLAMTEYGIGVEPLDDAELTDPQKIELRKQEISRKKLVKQADEFFKEEASKVALPDYDPLELDPDYKEYRSQSQVAKDKAEAQATRLTEINTGLETAAKAISEITENFEIDIDGDKLVVPVNFKFTKEKQKELTDFAKRYQPTNAEYDAFNDSQTGKFDYEGYQKSLAPICFAKEIAKAGMRQALTNDRQKFIDKELKNSTLRNNDVSQTVDKPFDIIDVWPFGK